ncbi:MAG: amidase [Alphaproteobacteria bacterium]|nr:amidase [Alphaproteobacteria bacterium]MBU0887092.1 amidase [Alphaproteobacteria bacterium]MBU1814342.1 amidase [Alphaproteobacteria bacterium]
MSGQQSFPLPSDPLADGIAAYGHQLRAGKITAEAATRAYLDRIKALNPKLGAFQLVMGPQALASARAIDKLLAAGTDLGPLMGVPVAVKDLFAIDGTPATAGTKLDVTDLIGTEGSFVKLLRKAGCIILGKTKTVEFALGATGVSTPRGTPWNPWDAKVARLPGGSSSGSAVATAAGLCGFAIGSDTGGSVRVPAALCGIFGLKTTVGLWATDGVFPLSPTFDTIGPLTKSAEDAAQIFAGLTERPVVKPAPLDGLRLGRPVGYFFDNLDKEVAKATDKALAALTKAGASIVDIEVPEAAERSAIFPIILPVELVAGLGRKRFKEGRRKMDKVVGARAAQGLDVGAPEYLHALYRTRDLEKIAADKMEGLDGWIMPTSPILPAPVEALSDPDTGGQYARLVTQNTQPGNLFRQSGTSTPIQAAGGLPIGLQLLCPAFAEEKALSMALAMEKLFGKPAAPDLTGFM